MTIKELKKEIIKEYKESLDSNSKFYEQDLCDFSAKIKTLKDKDRLEKQLGNLSCLNGKSRIFNNKIGKELSVLDKSGMFDIKKMQPKNALD